MPRCIALDDLVGAGAIGLMQAVDRFQPSRGLQFGTYARHRIWGAMLDFLRGEDPLSRAARRDVRATSIDRPSSATISLEDLPAHEPRSAGGASCDIADQMDLERARQRLSAREQRVISLLFDFDWNNREVARDDPKSPRYIETVPTVGYRFIAQIDEGAPPRPDPEPLVSATRASQSAKPAWVVALFLALVVPVGVWRIVVSRSTAGPWPLSVSRVSKLTSYPGDEREPSLSPDGSYVAFSWSGPSADNYDIYTMQAGGPQPLRLTTDPAPDSFPAWSPDGRQIAFIRRSAGMADIIVVPPLGGPERTLHRFPRTGADLDFTQHPVLSWSPDGKWIVYSGQSSAGTKYRLYLLSVDTGAVRSISTPDKDDTGDSLAALSPDARVLAFTRYLAPRNGRMMVQPLGPEITPQGEPAALPGPGLETHSPAWLDEGSQLLFADRTQIFQWDQKKGTIPIYSTDAFLGGMSLGPKKGDTRQLCGSEPTDRR